MEILLSLIDDNPFNCRREYAEEDIRTLAGSLAQSGLLEPIKVRKTAERYQVVYGHRRVKAARLLGLDAISADVVSIPDKEMLKLSLVENLQRKNLSDYDKALSFRKMNEEFGMNYEEIGKLGGFSKSHVCNHLRMLELFDGDSLEKVPALAKSLRSISEHHARVLLQIDDKENRKNALDLVVSENLSVRELSKIVQRFRSWFETGQDSASVEKAFDFSRIEETDPSIHKSEDVLQIESALRAEFSLPHTGDLESFLDMHDFDHNFSIYSNFPPFGRLEKTKALDKEKNWFYSVAPKLSAKVQDVHVQFYGQVALATLYVNYYGSIGSKSQAKMKVRGTVLFEKKASVWKIVHEHWSRLNQERGILV